MQWVRNFGGMSEWKAMNEATFAARQTPQRA
jgi:hypothetical protein